MVLRLVLIALALLASGSCAWAQSGDPQAIVLITEQEAALPPAAIAVGATRAITRAPQIMLASPAGANGVPSPTHFRVEFRPHGGAQIDFNSLKVTYMKSPSVDLTDRVKPFRQNNVIDIQKALMPPGEHLIRVTVLDSGGRQASELLTLHVKEP
jgi:hypothetical protein